MFFSINFKSKGWGNKTKRWGSAMLPPFGGNTASRWNILRNLNTNVHVAIPAGSLCICTCTCTLFKPYTNVHVYTFVH